MNYLAHLFLSYDDSDIAIGNFIADHVQGNKFEFLKSDFIKGIKYHRLIDSFTDQHPVYRKSCSRIRKSQRHYSPVAMDLFYDHFLALHWDKFSDEPLEHYCQRFYSSLLKHQHELPAKSQKIVPYLIKENWFIHYKTIEGIQKSLRGISRRSAYQNNLEFATNDLFEHFDLLEQDFFCFFDELTNYCKKEISKL